MMGEAIMAVGFTLVDSDGGAEKVGVKRRVNGTGLLRAMRHVLKNHESWDKTEDERAAREWLLTKKEAFLKHWNELEREDSGKSVGKVDSSPDLGHDAACRVLDRLLKEASK